MICEVDGCSATTREGKPFCLEHVERMPRVQVVLARLAAREKELAAVAEGGWPAVLVDGIPATEILSYLRIRGERTIERLRRDRFHDQPDSIVESYVKALEMAELITTRQSERGGGILRCTQTAVVE